MGLGGTASTLGGGRRYGRLLATLLLHPFITRPLAASAFHHSNHSAWAPLDRRTVRPGLAAVGPGKEEMRERDSGTTAAPGNARDLVSRMPSARRSELPVTVRLHAGLEIRKRPGRTLCVPAPRPRWGIAAPLRALRQASEAAG